MNANTGIQGPDLSNQDFYNCILYTTNAATE